MNYINYWRRLICNTRRTQPCLPSTSSEETAVAFVEVNAAVRDVIHTIEALRYALAQQEGRPTACVIIILRGTHAAKAN
ncbi:hypothetical protein A4U49_13120 [Acidithiobacillus ferrivorans]|uniref:hypothetical protein n=1 Tax=Acidithiobacillus ferrivorans TaxID=160808 RepID=UPI000893895D|nr:hypothetical protein [Acidithiobacillus ferrivorans]OFA15389.1 hypothetical protein A4U49_13120 [Acidithiobacillus ferrivorans]